MILHESSSPFRRKKIIPSFAFALLLPLSQARGVDFIDDFEGTELNSAVWESTGPKSRAVASGFLTFSDDGGNWGSGDISTNQRFLIPPAGETTTIAWTLGPGSIITSNADNRVIRYQVGIHSANESSERKEHWLNTTGGLWIDLDVFDSTATGTASGNAFYAANNKVAQSQASTLGRVSLAWNWETENHVLKLTLTDTEYSWFDGETLLYTDSYENAGIDTEFNNGFRVLALGMNFDSGRGTTSFDKIEILNASEPAGAITSFASDKGRAFSGQEITLSWLSDEAATLSIDQGIGNVDALTTNGAGQISFAAPGVTESTNINYTLTAVLAGETVAQVVSVEILPTLPLSTESFTEEFDEDFLDDAFWGQSGNQTLSLGNGKLNCAADGTAWSHGEIETRNIFPIPEGTNTTTITWIYGPSTVTVDNGDGTAIRALIGIFSGFEDETYSKQHWQNDEGGIWLDLNTIGETRTDGVSGSIHAANDNKTYESNAEVVSNVDVPDWSWQTENHEFSLVLSATGFTWFSGTTELGGGNYADYNIDTEFEAGFGVMAMCGNSNEGRGEMSIESISLDNGAVPFNPEIVVTDIDYDPTAQSLSLTWTSRADSSYSVERLDENGIWQLEADELEATGPTSSAIIQSVRGAVGIFRVIEE